MATTTRTIKKNAIATSTLGTPIVSCAIENPSSLLHEVMPLRVRRQCATIIVIIVAIGNPVPTPRHHTLKLLASACERLMGEPEVNTILVLNSHLPSVV